MFYDDPNPLGDEDFTYVLWLKRESINADVMPLAKETAALRSYFFFIEASGLNRFSLNGDNVTVNGAVTLNDTSWHFIVTWHDATANTLNLQIDNGTVISSATGGIFPANSAVPVRIGARGAVGSELYFDGLIDEVGLWRRVLTPAERTTLYNGGAGLTYPFA